MFDGTVPMPKDDKSFVALAVNGQQPTRVLYVRYPYDVYISNEVPTTHWTPIQYVSPVLALDMEKVSVDGVVMGFMYQKSFLFLFSCWKVVQPISKLKCTMYVDTLSGSFRTE
ncbi:uncharacterized protein TNIN_418341 [Trichonephila inaurata madagascariensis]|uniref:Uncharacterized protein n=1 Tax=Trichonephila inaurata madagascariensis TaxID=2747483 RepID=A0A8X6I6V1_9ARAC|nr:uncharacterized protein TNIN_418341 [Trichonephila inaurata madagascariensis]